MASVNVCHIFDSQDPDWVVRVLRWCGSITEVGK
jgi:hypothetical protein